MSRAVVHHTQVSTLVVEKWFTLIADRLGRSLELVTLQHYVSVFDKAGLTDRGLDAALEDLFGRAQFWSEMTPEAVIALARDKETDLRLAEHPLLPVNDAARTTVMAEAERRASDEQRAYAWAEANIEPARLILERRHAEFCHRHRVATVNDLTWQQQEFLKWIVIADYLNGGIRVQEPLVAAVRGANDAGR